MVKGFSLDDNALRRACMHFARLFIAAALLSGAARAQTFYWNPASGSTDALKASNWSANADGSGARPLSDHDDDFTADALGSAWTFLDGDNAAGGSASTVTNQDKLTLTGSGTDINATKNEYVAVYRHDLGRNVDVTIHLLSRTGGDPYSKAGILVANDLTNLTKGGYAMIEDVDTSGAAFASDNDGNGFLETESAGDNKRGAKYLRLVKNGKTITGYSKVALGDPWTQIGSVTLASADTTSTHIGIFSNASTPPCTVVFDDFEGGGALAATNLDLRFNGTGAAHNGNAALSASLTAASADFTGYAGTFSFGSATLTLSGATANFSAGTFSAGSGALAFTGPGTQTFTPKAGTTFPAVTHSGTGALKLGAALTAASFANTAGSLDFNGSDLTVTGSLQVTGGAPGTFAGLGGRTLTAGGAASFAGSSGSLLGMNPVSGWTIHAAGTLDADFATIANSNANQSAGTATAACVNGGGNSNWNFPAVNQPPSITRQPKDTAADTGQSVSFSVSASGTAPLAYLWRRVGDATTLSTDSVFAIAKADSLRDGSLYYCVITNNYGKDSTRQAKLTVNIPRAPVITAQPVDTSVDAGSAATFAVTATGTPAPTYAWKRVGSGTVISTSSSYTLAAPGVNDNGAQFYCVVTNKAGGDSSVVATLTVVPVCNRNVSVPADTAVKEGQAVTIAGVADCASSTEWTVESGPDVHLTDNLDPVLRFNAPRVSADTAIVWRFTAYYSDSAYVKKVKVTVKEAIPDPKITATAALSWNGVKPLALRPVVTNASALSQFPAWPVRYAWTLSAADMADTAAHAGDSLVLLDVLREGLLDVQICVDNGAAPACAHIGVTIDRSAVSIAALPGSGGAVGLLGRALVWRAPARVRAHGWDGRILWEASGEAGTVMELPAPVARALETRRARLRVAR